MQNLFINPDDKFVVEFIVATDEDGTVFCDVNKDSVIESLINIGKKIEKCEIESYKAIFKKPSFGDTMQLYDSIFSVGTDGSGINTSVKFNPVLARYNKIVALIKSWNLKGKDEKPTEEEIRRLHPVIANAIGVQIDLETGGILS